MPIEVMFIDKDGNVKALDNLLEVDKRSGALVRIQTVHHEIHEGHHFYIEGFTTLAEDLGGDEGTLYAKLVTPDDDTRLHFRWNIEANGILETNFYEGASGGMTGGAEATIHNSDRNSDNKSNAVMTSAITVATSKGTLISTKKVGGIGFKTAFGGASERDDELILKKGTTYFREFISGSAGNIVSFRASWYEHYKGEKP